MRQLLTSLLVVSLLTGCLDDAKDTIKSTIDRHNAKAIIYASLNGDNDIDVVDDILPDDEQLFGKAAMFKNGLAKTLVYCGADPQTDTGSGSMDFEITVTGTNSYSVTVTFAECRNESVEINGQYAASFSGDLIFGPQWGDGANATNQTFSALTITQLEDNTSVLLEGSITGNSAFESPLFEFSQTLDFAIESSQGDASFDAWTKNITWNIDSQLLTVMITGNFSAASEEGSYTFEMLEPISLSVQTNQSEYDPISAISGKFIITAEDNSSVTVTINDDQTALLEIDENGDGVIDFEIIISLNDINLLNAFDQ